MRSLGPIFHRYRPLVFRAAIGVVLLAGLFSLHVQIGDTLRQMLDARGGWLLAAVGVLVIGQYLTVLKWKWLLAGIGARVGLGTLVRASLVGMFYNNFLPGSVGGDVAKVLMVAFEAGGKARCAASVFTQRNTGLAALLVVGTAASLARPVDLGVFPPWLGMLNDLSVWFMMVCLGYGTVNLLLMSDLAYRWFWGLVDRRAGQRAGGGAGRAAAFMQKLHHTARRLHEALLLFRRGLPLALAMSLVTQLLDCVMIWCAARALSLDLVSFPFLLACVPMVSLAALIPLSVNGLGLREWVYYVLLRTIGVAPSAAVGLSLMHFGLGLGLSLVGGAIHWLRAGNTGSGGGDRPDEE